MDRVIKYFDVVLSAFSYVSSFVEFNPSSYVEMVSGGSPLERQMQRLEDELKRLNQTLTEHFQRMSQGQLKHSWSLFYQACPYLLHYQNESITEKQRETSRSRAMQILGGLQFQNNPHVLQTMAEKLQGMKIKICTDYALTILNDESEWSIKIFFDNAIRAIQGLHLDLIPIIEQMERLDRYPVARPLLRFGKDYHTRLADERAAPQNRENLNDYVKLQHCLIQMAQLHDRPIQPILNQLCVKVGNESYDIPRLEFPFGKFREHTDTITSVCVSADRIISGSKDATIRIWNMTTGQCVRILEGHTSFVNSVCVGGDQIISGSMDNTIRIWTMTTGKCVRILEGHTNWVTSVCVCGDQIISGSEDNTIRIWNMKMGKCVRILEGHAWYVTSVCVHGDQVISASYDETIRVWNMTTGECVRILEGHTHWITSVCVHGDQIISGSDDDTIRVWNMTTGDHVRILQGHTNHVNSVCVSSDQIISGSKDTTIRIWNMTTGECVRILEGHADAVKSVCVIGDKIISGSSDATIRIWNI